MDRFDELMAGFAEGTLDESERDELEALLASDADRREAFVEIAHVHRMLSAEFSSGDPESFARGVLGRIDRSETALVASVMNGVRRTRTRPIARHARRRDWRMYWLPSALAAAAACIVWFTVLGPGPSAPRRIVRRTDDGALPVVAEVTSLEGSHGLVTAASDVPGTVPLAAGQELIPGDRIETGAGSVRVTFAGDATTLELGADTGLTFADVPGARRIVLTRGTLVARVAKQRPGEPLTFVTPQAEATVLGTALALSVARESTRLEVQEGRVRFARLTDGAATEVGAGEFAVSDPRGAFGAMSLDRSLDGFEDGLNWEHVEWTNDSDRRIVESPVYEGTHALRIAYVNRILPGKTRGYSSCDRPITLWPEDEFLTFRVYVQSASRTAGMHVLLGGEDGSSWYMTYTLLRTLDRDRWTLVRVPLGTPVKKNNDAGAATYDPTRMTRVSFGVVSGDSVIYLDDFRIESKSAFEPQEE